MCQILKEMKAHFHPHPWLHFLSERRKTVQVQDDLLPLHWSIYGLQQLIFHKSVLWTCCHQDRQHRLQCNNCLSCLFAEQRSKVANSQLFLQPHPGEWASLHKWWQRCKFTRVVVETIKMGEPQTANWGDWLWDFYRSFHNASFYVSLSRSAWPPTITVDFVELNLILFKKCYLLPSIQ